MVARSVDLTEHLDAFVESQVGAGRHQDASEVVQEALRRYQADMAAEAARIAATREVIREGREAITQGVFTTVASETDADALFGRLTGRHRPGGEPG